MLQTETIKRKNWEAPWQNKNRPALSISSASGESKVWNNVSDLDSQNMGKSKNCCSFSSPICTVNAVARIWNQIMNTREILPEGVWEMRSVCVCSICLCEPECFINAHMPLGYLRYLLSPFYHPFIPTSLCVCPSVSLHLFLTLYIPWLPAGPRVASLESMAQASTLKKCKAADQSGLERQCTQRPQCESLLLPQSPLFTRLSCSQHAVVEDTGVCDHTWRRAGQHTGALELSGSATSSVLISGCSAVSVTCLWWLKAALKTIAPSQLLQMSLAPPPVSSQNAWGQRLTYDVWYRDSYSEWQLLGYDWGIQHNMTP